MFYTGTKKACEAYNKEVAEGMGLGSGNTTSWAEVIKHAKKSRFAILAHREFTGGEGLKFVKKLSEDWFPDEEL